jgi:hypothetical protein
MLRSAFMATALTVSAVAAPVRAQVILHTVVSTRPSYLIPVQTYTVQFRSLAWNERIFHNPVDAREFELLKRAEGFETTIVRHGYHTHVSYRLPYWQSYRTVSSHHFAHELARNLEYRGFEARVIHY